MKKQIVILFLLILLTIILKAQNPNETFLIGKIKDISNSNIVLSDIVTIYGNFFNNIVMFNLTSGNSITNEITDSDIRPEQSWIGQYAMVRLLKQNNSYIVFPQSITSIEYTCPSLTPNQRSFFLLTDEQLSKNGINASTNDIIESLIKLKKINKNDPKNLLEIILSNSWHEFIRKYCLWNYYEIMRGTHCESQTYKSLIDILENKDIPFSLRIMVSNIIENDAVYKYCDKLLTFQYELYNSKDSILKNEAIINIANLLSKLNSRESYISNNINEIKSKNIEPSNINYVFNELTGEFIIAGEIVSISSDYIIICNVKSLLGKLDLYKIKIYGDFKQVSKKEEFYKGTSVIAIINKNNIDNTFKLVECDNDLQKDKIVISILPNSKNICFLSDYINELKASKEMILNSISKFLNVQQSFIENIISIKEYNEFLERQILDNNQYQFIKRFAINEYSNNNKINNYDNCHNIQSLLLLRNSINTDVQTKIFIDQHIPSSFIIEFDLANSILFYKNLLAFNEEIYSEYGKIKLGSILYDLEFIHLKNQQLIKEFDNIN
jgi:hypothetical protein